MKEDKPEKAARIFLIDDHPVVRQGVSLLLAQESHIVCGEAGSKAEVLERIGEARADIAFLDLSLGEESGLELIADIRRLGIAVLVYSMHGDGYIIEKAFAAGADGYVTKRELSEVLLAAVSDLQAGRRHMSPLAAQALANRTKSSSEAASWKMLLSEREKQILSRIGRGESSGEIAEALAISVRTVETYYSRIIVKLDLDGMKALRQLAIRNQ